MNDKFSNEKKYPKISIVTPSFNSAKFIDDCIQNVLNQNYPNFEHIIIDGGSTDGTVEILKKYPHLKWISEPDEGQSDALNKGFKMAEGEWILWLNADDGLLQNALFEYAKAIKKHRECDVFYGHVKFIDENFKFLKMVYHVNFNYKYIFYTVYMPPSTGSLFRAKVLKSSPLDLNFHYTMDTEWFLRVGKDIKFYRIDKAMSFFRVSNDNKTSRQIKTGEVLPQHAIERQWTYQKYILPKIKQSKILNEKLYYLIRKMIRIKIILKKMKYAHLYIINKSRSKNIIFL